MVGMTPLYMTCGGQNDTSIEDVQWICSGRDDTSM